MSINTKNFNLSDYFVMGLFINVYWVVKYLPSPIGDILRSFVIRVFGAKVGSARIYDGVTIWYPYRMQIGRSVTVNEFVYLNAYGGLTIGDHVSIGHGTSIVTSEHIFTDTNVPIQSQGIVGKSVEIEDNVWIGANVTILAGVHISQGSVIAAGAVVASDVPSGVVVGGVPAKVIKAIESS